MVTTASATPAIELDARARLSSWELSGALLVFVVRLLFGIERRVYSVYADEPATLAMARWLSGGVHWRLFDNATWKPGIAIVLAPVYALTDDAVTVYRSGLLINSVIAGVSVIVAARIARRVANMSPRVSVASACAVALAPASLFASAAVVGGAARHTDVSWPVFWQRCEPLKRARVGRLSLRSRGPQRATWRTIA
jgi:hypothetical protein